MRMAVVYSTLLPAIEVTATAEEKREQDENDDPGRRGHGDTSVT
jgi:hypothetical protein